MTNAEIEFRPMEATHPDLEAFARCFELNGMPRARDALRWQYFDNPTGELIVELAVAEARVAAIYAVQPVVVRLSGQRMLAAQSVDTLVDADFRGRRLFTIMADGVYRRVSERNGAFVYGFPRRGPLSDATIMQTTAG